MAKSKSKSGGNEFVKVSLRLDTLAPDITTYKVFGAAFKGVGQEFADVFVDFMVPGLMVTVERVFEQGRKMVEEIHLTPQGLAYIATEWMRVSHDAKEELIKDG